MFFSFLSAPLLAFFYLFLLFFLALFLLFSLVGEAYILMSFSLFKIYMLEMKTEFILGKMDVLFSLCVLLISMSVMLFSSSYMSGDKNIAYFILMVCVFVFSMNLLIYIPHMISLLLGWDGLGLSSYLLVVYYSNDRCLSSGMITALSNRVGDAFIIMAISMCYYNLVFSLHSIFVGLFGVVLLMMLASFTKSAQIPFSAWLPSAMAAPTPVSALVHSSTLVTAGVFLLIRFYSVMSEFCFFNFFTFYLGVVTCLMASLGAIFENDLKKIIALSTLSQLGVMMFTLGLGMPYLAFFHLITHAMFKALMFICAGTIIHSQLGNQDIRLMGNIWYNMPFTSSAIIISNFALCGFPYMAGFYSKDMILESFMILSYPLSTSILCLISVLLTGGYTSRLCYFLLWSSSKNSSLMILTDESKVTHISYFILLSGAIFSGVWIMNFMLPSPEVIIIPLFLKLFVLSGIILLIFTMQWLLFICMKFSYMYYFINMWNLSLISGNLSYSVLLISSKLSMMEKSWIEMITSLSLAEDMKKLSQKLQDIHHMSLSHMMGGLVMLIFLLLFLI